jgi:hypothetical protein
VLEKPPLPMTMLLKMRSVEEGYFEQREKRQKYKIRITKKIQKCGVKTM